MTEIGKNFTFTKIAEGIPGCEGPVFSKTGRFYVVAPEVTINDNFAGQLYEIDLKTNRKRLVCTPKIDNLGGIPAGCQFDKDGCLWIADMRFGLLKVNDEKNICKQIAKTDSAGRIMQGCNDLIFDHDGILWITAPAGKIAPHPYDRSMREDGTGIPFGSLYRYDKEADIMDRIDTDLQFPNGIAVQHCPSSGKPKLLLVAETASKLIYSYTIDDLKAGREIWARIGGTHVGGPDGMDFDEEGRLLVANWGSGFIEVFTGDGVLEYRLKTPFQKVSNLHFKPNSNVLLITEHDSGAVWQTEWKCKGAQQFVDLL